MSDAQIYYSTKRIESTNVQRNCRYFDSNICSLHIFQKTMHLVLNVLQKVGVILDDLFIGSPAICMTDLYIIIPNNKQVNLKYNNVYLRNSSKFITQQICLCRNTETRTMKFHSVKNHCSRPFIGRTMFFHW